MEDALKEKLTRVLNLPIETEERVVYFFVELRKLMEQTKTKGKYPVVNFYCNWVVHVRLTSSTVADGIVHLVDDGLTEMLNSSLSDELRDKINELVNDNLFRSEMQECLEFLTLPSSREWPIERWSTFRYMLGLVTADCPLFLKASKNTPTRFVESVTMTTTMGDDGITKNSWNVLKFHTNPKVIVKIVDGVRTFTIRPDQV